MNLDVLIIAGLIFIFLLFGKKALNTEKEYENKGGYAILVIFVTVLVISYFSGKAG